MGLAAFLCAPYLNPYGLLRVPIERARDVGLGPHNNIIIILDSASISIYIL